MCYKFEATNGGGWLGSGGGGRKRVMQNRVKTILFCILWEKFGKFSVNFGKLLENFGKFLEYFVKSLKKIWKFLENVLKVLRNLWKNA